MNNLPVSEDSYDFWKRDPVTEQFFKEVNEILDQYRETIESPRLIDLATGSDIKEYAFCVGVISALKGVLLSHYNSDKGKVELGGIDQ